MPQVDQLAARLRSMHCSAPSPTTARTSTPTSVFLRIGALQPWRFRDFKKMRFLQNVLVGDYNRILDAVKSVADVTIDLDTISSSCALHTPDGIHYQQPLYLAIADQIVARAATNGLK